MGCQRDNESWIWKSHRVSEKIKKITQSADQHTHPADCGCSDLTVCVLRIHSRSFQFITFLQMVVLSLHSLCSKMVGCGRARLWFNSHQGQKFLSALTVMQPPVHCFSGPLPRGKAAAAGDWSLTSSVEVKNAWNLTFSLLYTGCV